MKEYLDTQSTADCTTFMDESFDSLRKFSDAFNVLPFIPVVVGTAITHHSLLTSLWVNVSHFPLKIFLSPLTSDTMVALGQMALLSYCSPTKCRHTGGTGTFEANTQDWYWGDGPNPRVRPWIECRPKPAEAKAGPGRANAIKERSTGGPVIQDFYTACASTGPSTRRYSTPTTSAISGEETQHSQRPERPSQWLSGLPTGTISTESVQLITECVT